MRLSRLLLRFMHAFWRISRGQTVRLCVVVSDPDGAVFLVPEPEAGRGNWSLPGAELVAGQSALASAAAALTTVGLEASTDALTLQGVYRGTEPGGPDQVVLYRLQSEAVGSPHLRGRFFPLDALPAQLDPAARRRLSEIHAGTTPAPTW